MINTANVVDFHGDAVSAVLQTSDHLDRKAPLTEMKIILLIIEKRVPKAWITLIK